MKTRAPRVRLCLEELEQRWVPSTAYSTNWSGYAVSAAAGAVTAVSGSWVVPQIVAGSNSGYSSAWVGIDGYNSSSVEQLGTDSDMVNGIPRYYAWWEMYPNPSNTISSMTVNPGDSISASVSYTSNGFVLQIMDTTSNHSFSTTQRSSTAQLSSAEWIQEAPSSFTGVLPLANFGKINFSNSQATISGTTGQIDAPAWSSQSTAIEMVTSTGSVKAAPSGLTDSGNPTTSSFSVTWVSNSSGGHSHGKKAPVVMVPQPASATSDALNTIAPFVFQSVRPAAAIPSSAAGLLSAPLNQTAPFSPIAPAPLSLSTASALVGGSDSLLLSSLPEMSVPAPSQTPPANPDTVPAPDAQPIPSLQRQDSTPSSDAGNRLSLPPERTGALIGETDEVTTNVEAAQNIIFLLPLAGACGLSRERTHDRRRRPFLC
jgi:hypothetical protein